MFFSQGSWSVKGYNTGRDSDCFCHPMGTKNSLLAKEVKGTKNKAEKLGDRERALKLTGSRDAFWVR